MLTQTRRYNRGERERHTHRYVGTIEERVIQTRRYKRERYIYTI